MQNILIGTRNPGKLREFNELLELMDSSGEIRWLDPTQSGISTEVDETGQTYLENATLKALAYADASGLVTLADDSGLEVDAIGGMPGVRSARFSPISGATDADRRSYLLSLLRASPQPWAARFRCVVVVARADRIIFTSEGVCEGEVIPQERGHQGFGYDPIFQVAGWNQTMAELEPAVKNTISHRARAFLPAGKFLQDYLKSQP